MSSPKVPSLATFLLPLRQFGFGELTAPGIEQWVARVLLFHFISELCDSELTALERDVFPLYCQLYELGSAQRRGARTDIPVVVIRIEHPDRVITMAKAIDTWSDLQEASAHLDAASQLHKAIETWAINLNVKVDWFLDALLRNLCLWRMEGLRRSWGYRGSMSLGPLGRLGSGKEIPDGIQHVGPALAEMFPIQLPAPFNPFTQLRSEHWKQVQSAYDAHYAQCLHFFENQGIQKAIRKRARKEEARPWIHIEWFVQYQLLGMSAAEIAATMTSEGNVESASISQAIKKFAESVGLPLRSRRKTAGTSPL